MRIRGVSAQWLLLGSPYFRTLRPPITNPSLSIRQKKPITILKILQRSSKTMLTMAVHPREQQASDEHTPLLTDAEAADLSGSTPQEYGNHGEDRLPARIAYRLYISHFLSTWNSRVFEFGAILYLASIYHGTLLPMSVYALSRGLAAIVFAPAVGYYIDAGNRLQVVRLSIGGCLSLDNT